MISLADLIAALHDVGVEIDVDVDAAVVADALLLAWRVTASEMPAVDATGATGPGQPATAGDTDGGTAGGQVAGLSPDGPATTPGTPLFDPAGGGGQVPATAAYVPRARVLPRPLELARAMRPLERPYPRGRRQTLDVAATVDAYADTGVLVPVLRPSPERWFDVDLVIDDSATMEVWRDLAAELLDMFRQVGAFRTVRSWRLDLAAGIVLTDAAGRPAPPARLHDPQSRRLVVVFSDCMDPAWADPALRTVLRAWGQSTPTVLLNPLPQRLWERSGLGAPPTRWAQFTNRRPGAANRNLAFAAPGHLSSSGEGAAQGSTWSAMPVAALAPYALATWAGTVAGRAPGGVTGVLLPDPVSGVDGGNGLPPVLGFPADVIDEGPDNDDFPDDDEPSAADLVRAFRLSASAAAYRLAVLGAAQPAVSLAVLNLFRQEVVEDAEISDLAEVVVSGLLEPFRDGRGELVLRYRDEQVQELLGQRLAADDVWAVQRAVSDFIARKAGPGASFAAAVADPAGELTLSDDLAPFAAASRATLRLLGVDPAPAQLRPAGNVDATDTASPTDPVPVATIGPDIANRPKWTPATIVAIDVADFARRDSSSTEEIRHSLGTTVTTALQHSSIPADYVRLIDRGDGFLLIIAPDVPAARLVADFTRELRIELGTVNRTRTTADRIRFRVAMHQGDVIEDESGFVGNDVVLTVRLVDTSEARLALADAPDSDLVLMLSSALFDGTVAEHLRGLSPETFRRIEARLKDTIERAWLEIRAAVLWLRPMDGVDMPPIGLPATGGQLSRIKLTNSDMATVVVPFPEVSAPHCQIVPDDADGWLVRDVASLNGTFLNDVRVFQETPLRPEDVLGLGLGIRFQVAASADASIKVLRPGDVLDVRWEIVGPLPSGERGYRAEIWLGRDLHGEYGDVVVKVVVADDSDRDRPYIEMAWAEMAVRSRNQYVAQVLARSDRDERVLWTVTPYYSGGNLHQYYKYRPLRPLRQVLAVADHVLEALDAVGKRTHGDLEPANLVVENVDTRPRTGLPDLEDLHIRVIDWDQSRLWNLLANQASPRPSGTEMWRSPEQRTDAQRSGAQVDSRSDLYSVGVLLYWAISGYLPFEAELASDDFTEGRVDDLQKQGRAPEPLHNLIPGVPPSVGLLTNRLLSYRREDRMPGVSKVSRVVHETRDFLGDIYREVEARALAGGTDPRVGPGAFPGNL